MYKACMVCFLNQWTCYAAANNILNVPVHHRTCAHNNNFNLTCVCSKEKV